MPIMTRERPYRHVQGLKRFVSCRSRVCGRVHSDLPADASKLTWRPGIKVSLLADFSLHNHVSLYGRALSGQTTCLENGG
jgi:hypothetical protein